MPEGQQIRVKGHTLKWEGYLRVYGGFRNGEGKAHCSCGWESEVLPSTAARKRAHRRHKFELLQDASTAV